ncbi:hypothetical protein J437_LFUL005896 [Ladona fulva]|uniref:Uncharacterized protein n=1 Tax=Ladona fulva TaxID=123851 RepID=A0A8K0KBA8_LADFU|nr:hypothetical protein J437_LFUL005896 [Ladona fulva]
MEKKIGSGGIRTHAPEETGALNQRLRPLGHATSCSSRLFQWMYFFQIVIVKIKIEAVDSNLVGRYEPNCIVNYLV